MDIMVFTPDYMALGILESPTAIIYTERYQQKGTFEIHIPITSNNVSLAQIERVVLLDTASLWAGIISIISKEGDEDNPEIVLKGYNVTEYLYRRICWGLFEASGSTETIIMQLLNTQVINPSDTKRAIPDVVISEPIQALSDTTSFQSTGGIVGEKIEALCSAAGLGFRLRFDYVHKQLIFEILKGQNRTLSQTEVPQCIFSSSYENLVYATYNFNNQSYGNVFLIAGAGEGQDRKVETLGEASGKQRYEVYIDARDLQTTNSDGMNLTDEEYSQLLIQRGEEKRSEYKETQSFDCTINPIGNIKYNVDYFLGDQVTILDEQLNLQLDATITEVQHSFDSFGESLDIVFGFSPLTLDQRLKMKLGGT